MAAFNETAARPDDLRDPDGALFSFLPTSTQVSLQLPKLGAHASIM